MGEEVKMSDYEANGNSSGGDEEEEDKGGSNGDFNGEEERVLEWEMGLPTADDLTPLSHPLISPELASAFSISLEPRRTLLDVDRQARSTLSNLRQPSTLSSSSSAAAAATAAADNFKPFCHDLDGSESRKMLRIAAESEEAEADSAPTAAAAAEDLAGRTALKRPRLVWNPQLHKRFVDVVAHLGIKNAVPKTIMQLMNVDGLTRENVASHLQKYRLYLKRMNGGGGGGLSCEDNNASSSDQLFASTPVPPGFQEAGGGPAHGTVTVPYQTPVPMYGHVANNHPHQQQQQQQFNQYHGNGFDGYGMMPVAYPHHNHHPHRHHHQVAPNDHIH